MLSADLGHYVGDGHQPLHCTENYDGDATNQSGVHSRYETDLVGAYQTSIIYTNDLATYISDVSTYAFNFIYLTNKYVDSTLYGDSVATALRYQSQGYCISYKILGIMRKPDYSVNENCFQIYCRYNLYCMG